MEALRTAASAATGEAYDELVTGQRGIRPHWQALLSVVRSLPGEGLRDRVERARRLFEDSGGLPAAPVERSRPPGDANGGVGQFDLLPLVLTPHEWRGLEHGLMQRARVLDAILADIYGAQRTLAARHLPPALVHANPQFLRPCRAADGSGPRRPLSFYAADLVRGPDGAWAVMADHVKAPHGAGLALLNRRALARSLPEAFRAIAVRQIAPFFEQWQMSLQAMSPSPNPMMALLTPGPLAPGYFEHALLARQLGVALVEGGDLAVRDAALHLKTLAGLKRIDVLLRRLDSVYCDPLELRPDSVLGAVGLVDAARAGAVAIANALGSGVAETPALAPFLPALARDLLGEELELPSLDVWWLGEKPAFEHAMADIDRMVVRPCLEPGREAIAVADLSDSARAQLLTRIRERPHAWTAQRPVLPSLAPTWGLDGLRPDPVVLRAFLVAREDGYAAMQGGVAFVPAGEPLKGGGQLGAATRDVWVLAEDAADVFIPPTGRFQRLETRRNADVQSRVADNLFWLGRTVERLDNSARLLRAALGRLATAPLGARDLAELRCLGRALEGGRLVDAQAALAPPETGALAMGLAQFGHEDQPFQGTLREIRRLTDSARDRLSLDMSATVDRLIAGVRQRLRQAGGDLDRLIGALDEAIRFVATFAGLSQENVVRGSGWRFLDLGRRIERGVYTCRGALSAFGQSPIAWESAMRLALELCDSTMTYRSRYLAAMQPAPVLDLALLDDSNPRSLAFQLRAIDSHLEELGRDTGARAPFPLARLEGELRGAVRLFEADERAWRHEGLALAMLRETLDGSASALGEASDEITRTYFSLVPAAHALGSMAQ